jgi:outer membrane protein assembly factor BamD (BamD/ComL family)
LTAFEYYSKKDYVNCAIILKYDINPQILSIKAAQSYKELVQNTYGKASKSLYLDGYRSYKKGNFNEAIINFNRSIDISNKNEYYIDDAYFYLANSYYKTSNFEEAKKIINSFISVNSDSSFVNDMEALLKKMS